MNEVTEIIIYSVKYKHVNEFPRFSEGVRPRLTKCRPNTLTTRPPVSFSHPVSTRTLPSKSFSFSPRLVRFPRVGLSMIENQFFFLFFFSFFFFLVSRQPDRWWCGLQESLFDDVQRRIDGRLGRGEVPVQLGQVVRDVLQLERFVHLPALPEGFSVHLQRVSTGPELAGDLGQRAEAFTVDVLRLRRAGGPAAFLGAVAGSGAAACDVDEGWSRRWTTGRDELGGGLVILSKVDDVVCGGLLGLCPLG